MTYTPDVLDRCWPQIAETQWDNPFIYLDEIGQACNNQKLIRNVNTRVEYLQSHT